MTRASSDSSVPSFASRTDEWAVARAYMSRHSLARIYQATPPRSKERSPTPLLFRFTRD